MADQGIDRGKIHKIGSFRGQLISGLKLDPYELKDYVWDDGSNIQFTGNGVEKIQGHTALFATTPTAPIRGMVDLVDSGVQKLYFGDQSAIYESEAAAAPTTVGSGYNGNLNESVTAPASTWSMVNFGTWVLATNGVDAPQIFKGTSFANLDTDSQFTTAEIFFVQGPHVLAFNVNGDNRRFYFSDEDDPETWLADVDNAAGSLLIRELDSQIMAVAQLGKQIAVYGKSQMFIVSYLGAPNYFGYQPAQDGIGAVSKKAVISNGRHNYGLGRKGFWVTDGVSQKYIDDPDIKEFVQDNIDWDQASKVNGFHDETNTQIVWFVPSVDGDGEPDLRLAFDYVRGVWSKGDIGFTSSIERQVFNNPILADENGDVFYGNYGNDANGSAITAYIRSRAVDLGEADIIKEITAIRIGYVGSGLRCRLGTKEKISDSITWQSYFEVPAGFEFQPIRLAGRYFFFEFQTQDTGDEWELQAIDLHGRIGGTR